MVFVRSKILLKFKISVIPFLFVTYISIPVDIIIFYKLCVYIFKHYYKMNTGEIGKFNQRVNNRNALTLESQADQIEKKA